MSLKSPDVPNVDPDYFPEPFLGEVAIVLKDRIGKLFSRFRKPADKQEKGSVTDADLDSLMLPHSVKDLIDKSPKNH